MGFFKKDFKKAVNEDFKKTLSQELGLPKEPKSTNIYKRVKDLYRVILDLKDYPIPIPRVHDIKSQDRFCTTLYLGNEHSFNFDSNLGLVTFCINFDSSSFYNINYTLKYYKNDDLLFTVSCYEHETKIYPQIFKDSEIKASDINLAIYEVEAYLKELSLDIDSIKEFHKEQVRILEEA